MRKKLKEKISESLTSVLPVTVIVLILSFTLTPMPSGTMVLFLLGAAMLILGMGFFSLGADMAMVPIGEQMGRKLGAGGRLPAVAAVCFLIGVFVTVAEPDLSVLARQVPAVPDLVIILTVAVGVGVFLVLSMLRTRRGIPLAPALLALYIVVFVLSIFVPNEFLAVAFDSGGVTTGPITVPFIMALGVGIASARSDQNSASDSFGLVALCSIGPILSVLLGILYRPAEALYSPSPMPEVATTLDAARAFETALPLYFEEVAVALLPIGGLFVVFQLLTRRFRGNQLLRIAAGLIYTYLGLVFFLCGVNVGFMPAGQTIGATVAASREKWLLIPIGMLIGYYIVKAEPAVAVLTKQVEEVSNGAISHKAMGHALSIGVCVSVGLAMLRVLTGLNIFWLLIPGYAVALGLAFFVPTIFTGIAFDSGGVASGPMTATFLLPFAMGACQAVGGDIMSDAFGVVAMVAMTPLVTIQIMGLSSQVRHSLARRRMRWHMDRVEDTVLYFD